MPLKHFVRGINRPTLRRLTAGVVALACSALAARAGAQVPARTPLEHVGPIEARSTEKLGNVFGIHALSDGRVLVNDAINQRLLMFDSTLTAATVLAAATGAPNPYGNAGLVLIPFHGDSTLILDGESLGVLVYDPAGKIARVMAPPKPSDVRTIIAYTGVAAVDAQGRFLYRGLLPAPRPTLNASGQPVPGTPPDSAPVLRGDFETRALDTIGKVGIPVFKTKTSTDSLGRTVRTTIYDPLLRSDAWAVLTDGTVALVRSLDYHIDWVRPDGTRYTTPKMPFDWRAYSDAEKAGLIDSMRAGIERNFRARMAAPGAVQTPMPHYEFVSPDELPNYPPTIKAGSIRADLDGNVWIPPTTSLDAAAGNLVYDVVNTRGEVVRRVQLPSGRRLVGFGRGGVLYFTVDDSTGVHLERARIR